MHYNTRGIVYVSIDCAFALVETIAVILRVYSRTFLTRSIGSDDFLIVIAFVRFLPKTALTKG